MANASTTAGEVYDDLEFVDDEDIYNAKAPDPWVAYMLAGIFILLNQIMLQVRFQRVKAAIPKDKWKGTLPFRSWLSAAIDNDDPTFTVVKLCAHSFVYLGGVQTNYQLNFLIMMAVFASFSVLDALRILLAFWDTESLAEFTASSQLTASKMRARTQLKPTNVYEDLTRGKTIVGMVFITQVLLISFVIIDLYESPTHVCHDGTADCPIAGTLGSWCLYILGIFMAAVYLLGPNTAFGQSQQNPAYWLKLLLLAKQDGTSVTWYDPVADQILHRRLDRNDWRLWIRFGMSFLINGVGFMVLVAALPIQVAAQSSLTGVVFRAVGMIYLVDLDGTPGYTMTLVEGNGPQQQPQPETEEFSTNEDSNEDKGDDNNGSIEDTNDNRNNNSNIHSEQEVALLRQQILDEVNAKLDALLSPQKGTTGALAAASGLATISSIEAGNKPKANRIIPPMVDHGEHHNGWARSNRPTATTATSLPAHEEVAPPDDGGALDV